MQSVIRRSPIVLSTLLLVLVFLWLSAQTALADGDAISGRVPKPRPDGQECKSVPNGLQYMEEVLTEGVGVTYYNSIPGHKDFISNTLEIESPFNLSLWDADGEPATTITFTNESQIVSVHQFVTGNNTWSEWITVTNQVDAIQVLAPETTPSTSLCFVPGEPSEEQPPVEMVDLSVTGYVMGAPTALDDVEEPIAPASLYTPTVTAGSIVYLYIEIHNTGAVTATNVQMSFSSLSTTNAPYAAAVNNIFVEDLAPGQVFYIETQSIAKSGLNTEWGEIILMDGVDVDSTPHNQDPNEDDYIELRFIGIEDEPQQIVTYTLYLPTIAK